MSYLDFKVKIPKNLSEQARKAIATEIIDHVIDRTKSGKDKDGNSFPSYSESYKNSFDFQFKFGRTVDLTLSGEMLDSMELLEDRDGELKIGYRSSDPVAGRVEGNVRGSYGQSSGSRSKARNFLGIERERLERIIKKYGDELGERRAELVNATETLQIKKIFDVKKEASNRQFEIETRDNPIKEESILKNKNIKKIFTLFNGGSNE